MIQLGIVSPLDSSASGRTHRQPNRLRDFVMDTRQGIGQKYYLKKITKNVYFELIDRLMSERKRRFSFNVSEVMKGTIALNPKSRNFLEKESIKPMANHYGICDDDLHAELHQVKRLIIRKQNSGMQLETTMNLYTMLQQYSEAFPDVFKLVNISLTLPVTSAGCERSFSCMKQLKTYLRNTGCPTTNRRC